MNAPKQILVTGGLGFIGSRLVRMLLETQPESHITVIDNLSGTNSTWDEIEIERRSVTIADLRTIDPAAASYDEVYHLASPVGSIGILNATGKIALDILEIASHAQHIAAASGAKLLYVSSSEVYGADGSHDEDTDLVVAHRRGARMEYAIGKLGAEHVLYNLGLSTDVELRIVRPFNCAGPGQSREMGFVVPTFVSAAMAGTPLPVHGDGSARRAFCHVDDMAAGLIAVQDRGKAGEIYNVGQPDGAITILELAERIIARLGSSSTVEFLDPLITFGPHWLDAFDKIPVVDRANQEAEWHPHRSLDQIIDDVAASLGGNGS